MCPANITRGFPLGFSDATELRRPPHTTSAAKLPTSSRHTRPGACSNPDGPAVSRSFLRNPTVLMVTLSIWCSLFAQARAVEQEPENGEHDQAKDCRRREPAKVV